MDMPGVVSVGIGQNESGEAIIIVGLDSDRTEIRNAVPRQLEGYEVRTEIVGTYKAQ